MEIAIYTYRVWAQDRGAYVLPERMATREFIQKARGEIYEKSEKLVDESQVTPEGQEK
jgi:hypothetical protein